MRSKGADARQESDDLEISLQNHKVEKKGGKKKQLLEIVKFYTDSIVTFHEK